jgi:hypothetical protein
MTWKINHDSIQSFCDLPINGVNAATFTAYLRRHEGESDNWLFGDAENLTELRRRVNEGWPEGVELINRLQDTELAPPQSTKRVRVRADQGDALDIHAVYRGHLDTAWEKTRRQHRRAPTVVRIVAMIAGHHMQDPEQFFYRGAAAAKLTDMLTEAGYSVEVLTACVAESIGDGRTKPDYCHTMVLKQSNAPLDLSNIAAVLCQQGFVRYFMFRSFSCCETKTGLHMGYYGSTSKLNALAMEATEEKNVKTIYLKYSVDSAEMAQAWIKESIEQIEAME